MNVKHNPRQAGVVKTDAGTRLERSWLPDMDLNHDKQIQSLLCYRYTIGQAGRGTKVGIFH